MRMVIQTHLPGTTVKEYSVRTIEKDHPWRQLCSWWLVLTVLIVAAWLICPPNVSAEGPVSSETFYQVTYKDRTIKNLPDPPDTNEGIVMVVRVSRFESSLPGYETISTGNQPVESLNPGRTVNTKLRWDGEAWIDPQEAQRVQVDPQNKPRNHDQAETRHRKELLSRIQQVLEMVSSAEQSVASAQKQLDAAGQDPQAIRKARDALHQAKTSQQQAFVALMKLQVELSRIQNDSSALESLQPTGKISRLQSLPDDSDAGGQVLGVRKPIDTIQAVPQRTQVWKLPAEKGQRTVHVSMAHPAGGENGSFYYVAYADTDGDGRPDKLVARSPQAQAAKAGDWTKWSFQTDQPNVYVGNAWKNPNMRTYCATPSQQQSQEPATLSSDVWFSGYVGGEDGFVGGRYWPYLSNIRVHTERPNPDYDTGPRVIIREQN